MYKKIQLERDALYEEVWTEPISRLAPKYGLSGNGLKKICAKLNIPVPPRGYWARIQHGYKAKKVPLPKLKKGGPETHTLQTSEAQTATKKENLSPEAIKLIEAIDSNRSKIIVPRKLTNPHTLTRQVRDELKTKNPDEHGTIRTWGEEFIRVRVSPNSMARALRIMNTLLKAFGYLYLQITKSSLNVFHETIEFSLAEEVRRTDHISTQEENEKMKSWPWSSTQKWDYHPTGKLFLRYDLGDGATRG